MLNCTCLAPVQVRSTKHNAELNGVAITALLCGPELDDPEPLVQVN